ncbi:hypothetical protein, partial [Oryzihumus sp.]
MAYAIIRIGMYVVPHLHLPGLPDPSSHGAVKSTVRTSQALPSVSRQLQRPPVGLGMPGPASLPGPTSPSGSAGGARLP